MKGLSLKTKRLLYSGAVYLGILLLLLMAVGCSGQTKQANDLIGDFNSLVEKHNKLDNEASELLKKINTSASTKEEYQKNVDIWEQIEGKIAEEQKILEDAAEPLEKAKKLDISKEFETYIDMKLKANDANKEQAKKLKDIAAASRDLYSAMIDSASLKTAEIEAKTQAITKLTEELDEQKTKAEDLAAEANDYYEEHNLGK